MSNEQRHLINLRSRLVVLFCKNINFLYRNSNEILNRLQKWDQTIFFKRFGLLRSLKREPSFNKNKFSAGYSTMFNAKQIFKFIKSCYQFDTKKRLFFYCIFAAATQPCTHTHTHITKQILAFLIWARLFRFFLSVRPCCFSPCSPLHVST